MATPKKNLYFACSVGMMNTPRYKAYLTACKKLFPVKTHNYLEPCKLWDSTPGWLAAWPGVRKRTDLLVFATHDGTIGRGVWREIKEIQADGKPTFFLDEEKKLHEKHTLRLHEGGNSWIRYATVSLLSAV